MALVTILFLTAASVRVAPLKKSYEKSVLVLWVLSVYGE
jgi:hypothetical protein